MIEPNDLILSLDWLCDTRLAGIQSRDQFRDFLNYYTSIIASLQQYADENNNKFISLKVKELPVLSITDYYERRHGRIGLIAGYGKKAKLSNNLNIINAIGCGIVEVLRHPGLDEMIMNSAAYKDKQ